MDRYFKNSKFAVLSQVAKKAMFTHQRNKHLKKLNAPNLPQGKAAVDVVSKLKTTYDPDISNKYKDL